MGKLVFRVASDWQEVVRLRTEIEKLKQTLLSMDSTQSPDTFKKLNVQLGESTKKMNILISDAAKAGATMENDFKKVSIRPRACFSPSYNKVKSQTKHVWLLTLL